MTRRKHFCRCGKPIHDDEEWCISCEIDYENRYRDNSYEESILTDEIKEKYIQQDSAK